MSIVEIPLPLIRVRVPVRTGAGLNDRCHWRVRAKKTKEQRQATYWLLRHMEPAKESLLTVTLTRLAPSNGLDDDNLAGSLKAVRDGVADWLGIDDRDPRVKWAYGQRRDPVWGVEIEVRPMQGYTVGERHPSLEAA